MWKDFAENWRRNKQKKKRKKRKKDSDITSIALDGDIVISSDDIVIFSNDTIVYTLMAKILLGQLILELHIISLVDVMSEWEMNPQLKLLALKMCVWILILSAGCGLTMWDIFLRCGLILYLLVHLVMILVMLALLAPRPAKSRMPILFWLEGLDEILFISCKQKYAKERWMQLEILHQNYGTGNLVSKWDRTYIINRKKFLP